VTAAAATVYAVTPAGPHSWHWLHLVSAKLYYVPILWSFGVSGAFGASMQDEKLIHAKDAVVNFARAFRASDEILVCARVSRRRDLPPAGPSVSASEQPRSKPAARESVSAGILVCLLQGT
jgi:hypothetical protein